MKVVVLYGPGDLRIEERNIPEPSDDKVLLKVKAITLCPTDIRKVLGHIDPAFFPLILGHEGAGVVEAVGPSVTRFKPGDKVWPQSIIACGVCRYCLSGKINLCDDLTALGYGGGSFVKAKEFEKQGMHGVWAEYTLVKQNYLIKLPDDIPLSDASMIEPISNVIKSVNTLDVSYKDVAVIGCGPMGLLHIMVASALGAGDIIAIDPIEDRLALSTKVGATNTIDPSKSDPVQEVMNITGGNGVDVVIVAAGGAHQGALTEQGLKMVNKEGKVSIFAGTYPKKDMAIDPNLIHYKEIVLLGSFGYHGRHPYDAINLIRKNRGKVEMIRHPVFNSLEDILNVWQFYGKPGYYKIGIDLE
jgi:L-iditol 2-dehydrogenase